ncbi:type-F conjugative transfer system pilin assembly protein TrbC [Serratia sp. UGAL515B_01]|uniref:type-F conjugative transfer system pilin assembly protein TrbC n=1 Tax=Serratia sp. UGAL515B_01 TaxID=2986763 RepID=UPI0029537565|nr:type-F conjugative transfer system pilin assembly protein TrbC [Serratia sp. UGAL515B_01]WON75531.1 type-F conjugative transfer system pilin assembly protein TrbC [Serratia sp. UGAL515B_01]
MEKKKLCCALILFMTSAMSHAEQALPLNEEQNEIAYFLSTSIPEKQLAIFIKSAEEKNIPVYFRGLIGDDMRKTARYIQYMIGKYHISGIQIDPVRYEQFSVEKVPALVKRCGTHFDIIYGNVSIKQSLEMIEKKGDCRKRQ